MPAVVAARVRRTLLTAIRIVPIKLPGFVERFAAASSRAHLTRVILSRAA
jgi:molybdopterin biosynthesis enzyme MoaB